MAPSKTNVQPGYLQSQLTTIMRKKKKNKNMDDSSSSAHPEMQSESIVPSTFPENIPNIDEQETTNDGAHTESSSQKTRGSNKNFKLAKLTANGEKVTVHFDPIEMKPDCEHRKLWSRHLGAIIRENNIIPHCTIKWRNLTPTTLDNLWQAVTDKFDSEDIQNYRDATIRHMKARWMDWRYEIKEKKIIPHGGDVDAIMADRPNEMTQQDWEWLLENHFFTEDFQKRSLTSKENKKKLKYAHRAGSKSYTQLLRELVKDGAPAPSFEDFFVMTRTGKDNSVDPIVKEKAAEMKEMRAACPTISDVDLVEGVFGTQNKGTILGMGSVLASQLCEPAKSKTQLRRDNQTMEQKLYEMELRMSKERAEMEQRIAEKMREERAEMMRMMSILIAGGSSSINSALMTQFNAGQSSGASSQAVLPAQPQPANDQESEDGDNN